MRREAGVEMIVAIDSTARGPALGGCRWKPYPDLEAARSDACALAAAMTRKAALARLSLGGGKAVVVGDPATRTREQLLAFGDLVESLEGRYITAADMGTGAAEMAVISERTRHVVGLPESLGGCGDPGPWTARGVLLALAGTAAELGSALDRLHVAIQGVGSVGAALAVSLLDAGARVSVADPRASALDRLRQLALGRAFDAVAPGQILDVACDVLAPCGPPGVIDVERAGQLRCRAVCGAANNPLTGPEVAAALARRGILYVPDHLANAGGLIRLAVALEGGGPARLDKALSVIPENLARVLERSKARGIDPLSAARELEQAS